MPIRVNSQRISATRPDRPAAVAAGRPASGPLPFNLPPPDAAAPQLPPGVSLCMIVKNEERFLRACLESVRGAVDEICIVDTGSTDRTREIASEFGARVVERAWRNDFAWARNEALALATRRWILVLDADETLRPESIPTLRTLANVPAATTGMWVRCYNHVDDYAGTGASSHAIARVFPNSPRIRYLSPIHEYITCDGNDTGIEARHGSLAIDHYGYLGAIVKERGKAERNLAIIQAAVESDPGNPFHWYNLGTTALIEKRGEAAIAALEKMLELVGDEARGFVPSGLSFLADAYNDYRNDPTTALRYAELSLKRSPRFANAHFVQGKSLAHLGRYEEALRAFQASIDDLPHNKAQFLVDDEIGVWKAQSEIGSVYGRMGEKEQALEWFETALQNRPGVLPVMYNRGKALEWLGRFDEAVEQFKTNWETFGDDSTATEYINVLLRRHRYADALAAVDEISARVTPRHAALLLMTAAGIAERAGVPERAGDYARRALERAPGAAPVLDAAEIYFRERGDDAAIEELRARELDAPVETVDDYARRTSRLLVVGRHAEAQTLAAEGRKRFGDDSRLVYDAAAAAVVLGDRVGALALLEIVDAKNTDVLARARYLRAVILGDLGRLDEAIPAIDAFLALSPLHVDATLARGKYLLAANRAAEAEATLREAFAATGDQRIAVDLASVLLASGRLAEARQVAEAALAPAEAAQVNAPAGR
jgi:tetratricopeptide (TPR) repeat protein